LNDWRRPQVGKNKIEISTYYTWDEQIENKENQTLKKRESGTSTFDGKRTQASRYGCRKEQVGKTASQTHKRNMTQKNSKNQLGHGDLRRQHIETK